MKYPKITIITPSFQQGKYIEETILSIINQNYPNLEYLVMDGGSTDESVEIIKKYEKNITYWVSEKDKGQSDAINKGLARATGDIITWINSDDQLTPNTLHKVAEYFNQNPSVALVHGKTVLFGSVIERIVGADRNGLEYAYLGCLPYPQPSSFFKREVIEAYGGKLNTALHYGMDYDFSAFIALNYDMLCVEDVFSRYLFHQDSKSVTSNLKFVTDFVSIFSKVLRSFDFTNALIEEMKSLGMYVEGKEKYKVSKPFDEAFIRQASFYYLRTQVRFLYEGLDLNRCSKILAYIKSQNPDFYAQNQDFATTHFRSRYFPKEVLQWIRKTKRAIK